MKIADGELRQLLLKALKFDRQTVAELAADSKQTNASLLEVVLQSKFVDEASLARAYAKQLRVPFVDLDNISPNTTKVRRLPIEIARKYQVICYDETESSIKVAMANPQDETAYKALQHYSHKTVRRALATSSGLAKWRGAYKDYAPLPLSTIDLLATIIEQALAADASYVHFEPHNDTLLIKQRVGDRMQTMSTLPKERLRGIIGWCKARIGADVDDASRAHQGCFVIRLRHGGQEVMVQTVPMVRGEKLTLRLLPSAQSIKTLSELGFSGLHRKSLESFVAEGRGLLIVGGSKKAPIGDTLSSLALLAGRTLGDTVSVEDPLLYQIESCSQIEVTDKLPLDQALRAALAENPNGLVTPSLGSGRMAEQLIDFALGSHLIVSGLYATSLQQAVKLLQRLPVTPALLAASLRLIIVEHRLSRLCGYCRKDFNPAGPLRTALQNQFLLTNEARLYRKGEGCSRCTDGHIGFVVAYEWLVIDKQLSQELATGIDDRDINKLLAQKSDFAQVLGKLAAKGIIPVDAATQLVA